MNEIVNVPDKLKCVLFADDTNILYSSKEIENNTVNIEMSKIHKWLCAHRLSINLSKLIICFLIKYRQGIFQISISTITRLN